jgi:hypothetical protein
MNWTVGALEHIILVSPLDELRMNLLITLIVITLVSHSIKAPDLMPERIAKYNSSGFSSYLAKSTHWMHNSNLF